MKYVRYLLLLFVLTPLQAALPVGDVIVSANQRTIRTARDMYNLVGLLHIGQSIDFKLYRNGEAINLTAVIQPIEVPMVDGSEFSPILAGVKIGEIRESSLEKGLVTYLKVIEVEVEQNAWEAGIRKDDIFYSVNKQLIRTLDEAAEVLLNNQRGMILNIQRENQELYLLINKD